MLQKGYKAVVLGACPSGCSAKTRCRVYQVSGNTDITICTYLPGAPMRREGLSV